MSENETLIEFRGPLVCPDCGSLAWAVVDDETEECSCDDCGLDFGLLEAVPREQWERDRHDLVERGGS